MTIKPTLIGTNYPKSTLLRTEAFSRMNTKSSRAGSSRPTRVNTINVTNKPSSVTPITRIVTRSKRVTPQTLPTATRTHHIQNRTSISARTTLITGRYTGSLARTITMTTNDILAQPIPVTTGSTPNTSRNVLSTTATVPNTPGIVSPTTVKTPISIRRTPLTSRMTTTRKASFQTTSTKESLQLTTRFTTSNTPPSTIWHTTNLKFKTTSGGKIIHNKLWTVENG